MKRLASLLAPPQFKAAPLKTQIACLMHWLFITGICSTLLLIPILGVPEYRELRIQFYLYSTLIGGLIFIGLNKQGHTQLAGAGALMLISAHVMIDNFLAPQWISPAHVLTYIVLLLSGTGYGKRGFIIAVTFNLVGLFSVALYRLSGMPDENAAIMLGIDYFVQMVLLIVGTVVMWMVSNFVQTMLQQNHQIEATLIERNATLEREVIEHQQAVDKNLFVARTTREIIYATQELLMCDTMDDFWRTAVELARARLGVERCSIYLQDYDRNCAIGTYGTNMQGQTVSEAHIAYPLASEAWEPPAHPPIRGESDWILHPDCELVDCENSIEGSPRVIAHGWNAKLAIRARIGPAIAVFYCDAAITGKSHDPTQLDLLALYCSLLGQIADRKHLTERLNIRTHELSRLLEISQSVGSTLELKPLLNQLLLALKAVVTSDSATINEFINENHDTRRLCVSESYDQSLMGQVTQFDADADIHIQQLLQTRKPVVIADVHDDSPLARAFRIRTQRMNATSASTLASVMFVPLIVRDHVIGYIVLGSRQSYTFNEHDAALALAFANQAAVLIESARTHEEGLKAATKTERSRLARELHDSVSQALFGTVLGLRTTLQYISLGRDPKPTVEYSLALAESGLGDIRALIFELRPEQLEKEGLIVALQKQAESFSTRYKVEVIVNTPHEEPTIPLHAKEALYRIGMEALQNTFKHAQATTVLINLQPQQNIWTLEVRDNGRGFDPNQVYQDHYGLSTMRERADQLGATLNIISQPGQGACVQVQIPTNTAVSVSQQL